MAKIDLPVLAEAFANADKRRRARACAAANLGMAVGEIDNVAVQAARVFYMLGERAKSDYGAGLQAFADALHPTSEDVMAHSLEAGTARISPHEQAVASTMGITDGAFLASKAALGEAADGSLETQEAAARAQLSDEELRVCAAMGVSVRAFLAERQKRQ